jgi:hypothetical protein
LTIQKIVFVSGLPSCALKTLSVFTSERIVFIACLMLSEYSFERLYHIANFEHDQRIFHKERKSEKWKILNKIFKKKLNLQKLNFIKMLWLT